MDDVTAVMERIQQAAHEDANIIFGLGFDEELMDALRLIVIATDFGDASSAAAPGREEAAEVAEKQRSAPPAAEKGADEDWDALWDKFFK